VFAFATKTLNPIALCDLMHHKYRWMLSKTQCPLGAHLAVTLSNAPDWKKFIADVISAIDDMKRDPSLNHKGEAAMYGLST